MKRNLLYIAPNPFGQACWICLGYVSILLEPMVAVCWFVSAIYGVIACLLGADGPTAYHDAEQFGVGMFAGGQKLFMNVIHGHPVCQFILVMFWYLIVGTLVLYPVVSIFMLAVRIVRADPDQRKQTLRSLWDALSIRRVRDNPTLMHELLIAAIILPLVALLLAGLLGLIVFGGNKLIYDKGIWESLRHAESIVRHVCVSVGAGMRDFVVFVPGFVRRNPLAGAATAFVLLMRLCFTVMEAQAV